jgi:uncharacterized OsmC-like protein
LQRSVSWWNGLRQGASLAPRQIDPAPRKAHVKITLLSDDSIRLEANQGPFTIDAASDDQHFSPFHMMGAALASCTMSAMYAWAEQAKLDTAGIVIDVSWTFADDPHRVGSFELAFRWPRLPENRVEAAYRVTELCAIHATLTHPPAITVAYIA